MILYWDYNIKNISENVHILPNSSQKLIIGHMGKIGLGQIAQNLCNFVNKSTNKKDSWYLERELVPPDRQFGMAGGHHSKYKKMYSNGVEMLATL